VDGQGAVGRPRKLFWTGDLNGDGIGDFIVVTRGKSRLSDHVCGTLQWEGGYKDRPIPYKVFDVEIGCGANSDFHQLWNQETIGEPYYEETGECEPDHYYPLDSFNISVAKKPGSDIPSVCIESPLAETPLGKVPSQCLDMDRWKIVAGSPGR
jgi:hypothetical protein